MDLTNLPDEVILKLFSYLSIQDLGNWTKVSKRFRNICWDKALPYGEKKNIFVKTKAVEDSIRDTEAAIRKLKDNVLAWHGSAGELGLAEQPEDLVTNIEVEIRKLKNDVLAWRASVAPSWPQQQQGQPGSAEQLDDLVANTEGSIAALKNPNYNVQQQQQIVMNIYVDIFMFIYPKLKQPF